VSDSENDPLSGLLSNFALGPAWARGETAKQDRKPKPPAREERDDRRRDDKRRDDRPPFKGRGANYGDRRNSPPPREEAPPAAGVRVTIEPDRQAVHLIGKEIHQVARVYALYDIAQTLLAEKGRCRAVFEVEPNRPPLIRGKLDDSLFLTKEDAIRHIWESDLKSQLLDEETIEVDPPAGNFQTVARCGMSGDWLGPPNFHAYQTNLRRLHRERFSHVPFEVYSSRVRTERGEESVNAWLETMKNKTRWRLKGAADEEPWIEDRAEVERMLAAVAYEKAFEETRKANLTAAVPAKHLSPSLLTSLKLSGSHARKHPAILIPSVCRAVEAEHLPVFKRQGKLHTGPARPQGLAADAILAERPGIMVNWIRANTPAKLAGLWEAVLPEGGTAPPAEFAADLFWLLMQGHILLFSDDTLVVQELREPTPPKEGGKPKKKSKKSKSATATEASKEETPEAEDASLSFEEAVNADAESTNSEPEAEEIPAPSEEPEIITSEPDTEVAQEDSEEREPS